MKSYDTGSNTRVINLNGRSQDMNVSTLSTFIFMHQDLTGLDPTGGMRPDGSCRRPNGDGKTTDD